VCAHGLILHRIATRRNVARRTVARAAKARMFGSIHSSQDPSMRTLLLALLLCATVAQAQVTAIRAGRLIDPDAGTAATNQVILVENGKFTAIGANVAIPQGAQVIDLSNLTVLPGLVDAHNHLALTYKDFPENNI
jgi:cytosine/adenosine deaminase-related metal-dependent hydrolase